MESENAKVEGGVGGVLIYSFISKKIPCIRSGGVAL